MAKDKNGNWVPALKFTCGLNVPQEEWNRIFKRKKKKRKPHKVLTDRDSECKAAR